LGISEGALTNEAKAGDARGGILYLEVRRRQTFFGHPSRELGAESQLFEAPSDVSSSRMFGDVTPSMTAGSISYIRTINTPTRRECFNG
jgi:hypothetical protein